MFRYVLCFILAVSCASASIKIIANPVYGDSVDIAVETDVFPESSFPSAVTFTHDYILTVTGGTGGGIFTPCLFTGRILSGPFALMGGTSASFGNDSITSVNGSPVMTCPLRFGDLTSVTGLPFTFGVPQTFTVSLSIALDFEGFFRSELFGFQFFPTCMPFGPPCPTDIHFTLVSVDLPEASSWSLLAVGLMLLVPVAVIFRGKAMYVDFVRSIKKEPALTQSESNSGSASEPRSGTRIVPRSGLMLHVVAPKSAAIRPEVTRRDGDVTAPSQLHR